MAARASEKGLDLGYLIAEPCPVALAGDVTRLRQILINLIGNALKFTEQGEVVVTLDARQLASREHGAPAGDYELHVAVRDTGIGIPKDRMDRLFRSFSQVDASTTRRYGGTGLGLAISKRLSEMMGGRMWVESDGVPGHGTTFHFTLCAAAASDPGYAQALTTLPDLAGKRVLVVDDNATNRQILLLQTQGWGMAPLTTGSPREALEWVRRGEPFDVAILDMHMPEMDGLELAMAIQRERDPRALPLVMLSSLMSREAHPARCLPRTDCRSRPAVIHNTLAGVLTSGEQFSARSTARARVLTRTWPNACRCTSCSPRTTPPTRSWPCACSSAWATGRTWWATAWRRSTRWNASATTWCSWTCRCRKWTAWRPRARSAACGRRSSARASWP
jgi:CheY-like chemotaxis protein